MIFFSIKHSLQRSKHYISVTSWMRVWTSFMQLVMAWISLSTQLQSTHSSPRSSTQEALSTNACSSSISTQIYIQLSTITGSYNNHRPKLILSNSQFMCSSWKQTWTHTLNYFLFKIWTHTLKNWAKYAPFSSCPVYFSATANSRRKIEQK